MIVRLASGSPRRRQLLEWAGVTVRVEPPDVDESWIAGEHPAQAAVRLALAKVAVGAPGLALAADTVVHRDGEPFGKPVDEADARAMLARLSGVWHEVTTGVAVRAAGGEVRSFGVSTAVRFRTLGDPEIARYVASGEPMDKAGAYGIQGLGGALVAELRGSWTNVMGLPLEEALEALRAAGWRP